MSAPCYIAWNQDTSALTGPPTAVNLTSGKPTMLQIKAGASKIRVVEWGYSFTAVPTAPVYCELVETGTVFATVTSLGSNGIRPYNDDTGAGSLCPVGTTSSGFTASAEGSITTSRLLAFQEEWNSAFKQQFPLGREPEVNANSSLRLRFTCANAMSVSCYVVWEE